MLSQALHRGVLTEQYLCSPFPRCTGRETHRQTDALADRCTGKTGAQADSKKKIIVSQMEDSKQAAAKAEVEQYA